MIILQTKGFEEIQNKYKDLFIKIINKAAELTKEEIKNNIKPFSESGDLLQSIKVDTFQKKINVYSDMPYARIQNLGGKMKVTEKQRKKFWALFYATSNRKYKAMALSKTIEIPAKHYTDVDYQRMEAKLNLFIKRLLK